MSAVGMLNLLFWIFWIWRMFGAMLGLLTKKERLSVDVILDAILILANGLQFIREVPSGWCFVYLFWTALFYRFLRRDYRMWKNTDDDDEWKQRRKSWAKSHLPKPVTKSIPQPI